MTRMSVITIKADKPVRLVFDEDSFRGSMKSENDMFNVLYSAAIWGGQVFGDDDFELSMKPYTEDGASLG